MEKIKYKSIIEDKDVKELVNSAYDFCIDLAYACQAVCDKANETKKKLTNSDTFEVQGVRLFCLDFICRQESGYEFMGYYPEAP